MTWTVRTSKNSLDAYVWARSMGAVWKISLHASGDWHAGFMGAGIDKFVPPGTSSYFDEWRRPDDFHPGFHRSIEIVVPDCELRAWPAGVTEPAVRRGRVIGIPAPGAGNVAVIEVAFTPPPGAWGAPMVHPFQTFPVGTLVRPDASLLHVIAAQRPWDDANRLGLQQHKANALSRAPADWWTTVRAPRSAFLGKHDDDIRYVIDAAADPPDA
jgi:hypothetical protein